MLLPILYLSFVTSSIDPRKPVTYLIGVSIIMSRTLSKEEDKLFPALHQVHLISFTFSQDENQFIVQVGTA